MHILWVILSVGARCQTEIATCHRVAMLACEARLLHDEIQSLKSEKLISSRLHSQKVSRIIIIEINILFEPITFLKEYKITHLMSEKERLEKILQGANSSILDFKNQNKTIKLKLDQEIESKSILEKKNVSIKIIS